MLRMYYFILLQFCMTYIYNCLKLLIHYLSVTIRHSHIDILQFTH